MSDERLTISESMDDLLATSSSGDYVTMPLTKAIAELQEYLSEIPEKWRETAVVRLVAYGDYASGYFGVAYERDETDDEFAKRKRHEAKLQEQGEERERATYYRLHQKYGEITHD